ncbi:Biotin carboxyl carrier protein of acetyl-CoA carboxylase [Limosilactobacillus reuteri]|uniref:Biotin carboxyl carrier protein of acetyl-CoA carboxylase n=1 Tax=Limosilactobacillus reuteri TaxID=1598 RepID=A0A0U5JTX2_LIMRT|nr:biotin/lipoyl-containing protein [Limosilactobacillus reuteri]CUR39598.1 Biotin carboxyl carrier protein of acetyl-CoA carboxylase [Limosilactobacillus reuteri subsp. porcinus]CUR40803.1 Biotin carboxyl carrier protein of acetyl-CoA carboxylase [Limosilactobacillus reuteri]
MEFKEIQTLMQNFKDSDIRELEINQDSFQLYLSKNKQTSKHENLITTEKTEQPTLPSQNITAPLVGTVYLQPTPDADPYVRSGDHVKKGDVVCVIEAMKMMTEIKSPFNGIITSICVSNEELVEVEQPLFSIQEDKDND